MRQETQDWLTQAGSDLQSARRNLEAEIYNVCLFLCQQTAEKALKALYIHEKKQPPPKTHSLQRLARLTEANNLLTDALVELEDYYLGVRYPNSGSLSIYEVVTSEQAEEALETAGRILEEARRRCSGA